MRGEDLRHEEVHETPELHQVILQRRPGNEQPPPAVEVEQRLPALRLPVLDHVGLVQDQELPLLPPEHLGILHHHQDIKKAFCTDRQTVVTMNNVIDVLPKRGLIACLCLNNMWHSEPHLELFASSDNEDLILHIQSNAGAHQ